MNVTDIENIICESLKEVIDVPPEELARDTTFDALGLDSISRVGLVTQLEKAIGREIDPEISYEHDTPHSLAVYVATLLGGSSESGAKLPSIQMTYSPPTYTVEQVDVNTSEFKSILQLRAIAYEREAAGERDEVDSYSLHFAARSKDRIIGAVRTTCRKHGPLESEEFYPHWLLGEFGDKLSAVSRLCIQPEFSGSRVPHDLIRCAWKVVLP